jgi:hypothetical protein
MYINYMETLLASIAVLFVPNVSQQLVPGIMTYFMNILFIMLITLITNMVRAYRHCDSKDHSYGVEYGIKKGLTTGIASNMFLLLLDTVPKLRMPLAALSYIPVLSNMIDGMVLSLSYMVSYYTMAWPVWGSC